MIETTVKEKQNVMTLSRPIGILSSGMFVPENEVSNEDLSSHLDTSDEWIVDKTGIKTRRFVSEDQATSDLCIEAAKQAIENAGLDAQEIDAIIIASFTPDQILPSTSVIVKDALGINNAITIDMNQAACAGGIYGLFLGTHLLQNPSIQHVLVIGAESLSKYTNPQDRTTRVFFGDAAGAVILHHEADGYNLLSWELDSELSYKVEIPAGGSRKPTNEWTVKQDEHYIKMDGRTVWNMATKHLPNSIQAVIDQMELTPDDIDHYIVHQANLNIIQEVLKKLGQPDHKTTINIDKFGNTGAATVLTVLHQAMNTKAVSSGDTLVIGGIGAGFIWGALGLSRAT
ncbi:ketoacyl-ACP synthase III [Rossellomorea marisflavi]|jgi:3-oxoacyl-[acyl-carrier-protein] synthase III|uniref:3-oxoacyl-ACP synthase III family protein n=1 Tax=Rossellomorea marisflavi TaxID=189381 RepID=UPI0028535493|nr:ketoacyl-ACP synthase III [Rossellomorea marisflavi]MDR4938176.1 ketoacyl-ACP synthase III [Rossellomorea marisflavi]